MHVTSYLILIILGFHCDFFELFNLFCSSFLSSVLLFLWSCPVYYYLLLSRRSFLLPVLCQVCIPVFMLNCFLFYFVSLFSLVFCLQFHFPPFVFTNYLQLCSHLSPILWLSSVCIYSLILPLFVVTCSLVPC